MGLFLTRKMKYFMVTMETRNFSRAADALCITRSPLTKVIVELEEALGGKLFHRKYNELEPTELALEWYERIKPVYNELLRLDSATRDNINKEIKIIFDASVPDIIYKYIISTLKQEQVLFSAERRIVSDDDIYDLENGILKIIVSFREISLLSMVIESDKWIGDSLGLLEPEAWDLSSSIPSVYLWKDLHSEYIKLKVNDILLECFEEIEFKFHNYDFSALLNQIHRGRGLILLPTKMATLYNSNGVRFTPLKNRHLKVFLYHFLHGENFKSYKKIKTILSTTI